MSKSRNRKKGNKTKKVNEKFNNEIIGIVIIGLGILIMVSLFSQQMGIIGKLIKKTSLLLMGLGSYIFPIFIIGTGIIFILDKYSKKELKISLIALIIFLSFLVLLDSSNISSQGFINRIRMANKMSASNKGGGVIGAFLGFFFYNLFGKIGGYLILLITLIVTLMILMEVRLKDIINYVKKFISKKSLVRSSKGIEKNGNFKKENKIKKKDNKKKSTERIINKNRNIKILEYKEQSKGSKKSVEASQENDQLVKSGNNKIQYKKPPLKLLNDNISKKDSEGKKEILNNAKIIEDTMSNFGIDASVTQINKGPTVTCYELSPSPGIKLSRIVSLDDNIALSLAASDIRIEAPIPGKAAVGIEVPNKIKDNVFLKEMLLSGEFKSIESDIPLTLGKDVSGQPIITSIDKMPHLLIAGATGSGKSVCINTIITSIVYKSSPDKVKLLLIDPKVVELSIYNDIPHLLIPVVTDSKKAASALNWAVEEMERRYKSFAKYGARDIHGYNEKIRKLDGDKVANEIPRIVIIIDELADLMMVAAQEIEDYISRLAQKARAAGMYLIVATQRPSVDVITGTIKANIPSRLSFAVSSQVDSRTILDMGGAEKLLGHGDMLFFPSHYSKPLRIQGTFVSDNEIEKIVDFLKNNYQKEYDEEVIDIIENEKDLNLDDTDELLEDAIELVVAEEQASISMLQRRLRIGYARAARLVDEMELRGIVGGHEGSKPRKVLISKEDMENLD